MTQATASDLILHHYETSPFSEKVRVLLGIKGAPWRSVLIPSIMPKPDLTPLTGGYRRTPVMQIGADIYLDTQIMLAEIERRLPAPRTVTGTDWAVNLWADRLMFQTAVPLIFGELGAQVPEAFIKDREQLSGRPFDPAAMAAAVPYMATQFRGHAAFIEEGLADRPWLAGNRPGVADAAAFMNIWFAGRNVPATTAKLLAGLPRVLDWSERMRALGHGDRTELTGAEALEIARSAEPATPPAHDPADPSGLAPGAAVVVMADDYGRDPVRGALVAATARSITIARDDPAVGRVHVHTPRVGYVLMAG
jgi:glutathione S-transferase